MRKKYGVIWADIAEEDLRNIIKYIALDNPANALKILKKIREKTSSLYISSKRGRIVPELQGFCILQYRQVIIAPWRIIYRISETEKNIYVLSVLDSHQNIEDILLKRLINLEI